MVVIVKRMSWRVTAARPSRQMIPTFVRTDTPRHRVRTDAAGCQGSSRGGTLGGGPQRVRKRPGRPEIARPRPWRAHEPRLAGGLPARSGADHRRFRHAGAGAFERSRALAGGPRPRL